MTEPHSKSRQADEFNRSLLNAILEASPEGILVVDEHGKIVSNNHRFLEIWKFLDDHFDIDKTDTMTEKPLLDMALKKLRDPESFIQRLWELYDTPAAQDHCEIELIDERTLERFSTGLFNKKGEYLGRVWFFRDITELKSMEYMLRERARLDALTGILNRGYYFEAARVEIDRAHRHKRPLSVLMLDLDHFKNINDHYGHAAGDTVLEIVCSRWQRVLRSADMLARIGGEEFSILMPDTDLQAARAVADRLLSIITDKEILAEGIKIPCTVSIGISTLSEKDDSIEDILKRCDNALYKAKNNGRNRAEVYN